MVRINMGHITYIFTVIPTVEEDFVNVVVNVIPKLSYTTIKIVNIIRLLCQNTSTMNVVLNFTCERQIQTDKS